MYLFLFETDTGMLGAVIALTVAFFGTLGGVWLYFLNKRNTDSLAKSSIDKSSAETDQIRQEMEDNYVEQLRMWLQDLKTAAAARDKILAEKDAELLLIHKEHLNAIKHLDEINLNVERFNKATRRLLAKMDSAYWECDQYGKLRYVNGAWLTLFGLEESNALGMGWMDVVPASDLRQLRMDWAAGIVDLNDAPIKFNILNPITQKIMPLRALYSPVHDSEGNVIKIIGVTVEVSTI